MSRLCRLGCRFGWLVYWFILQRLFWLLVFGQYDPLSLFLGRQIY
jgi:hypothetical protein